jgi:hypothetical protein
MFTLYVLCRKTYILCISVFCLSLIKFRVIRTKVVLLSPSLRIDFQSVNCTCDVHLLSHTYVFSELNQADYVDRKLWAKANVTLIALIRLKSNWVWSPKMLPTHTLTFPQFASGSVIVVQRNSVQHNTVVFTESVFEMTELCSVRVPVSRRNSFLFSSSWLGVGW